MKLTLEFLKAKRACADGLSWFEKNFGLESDYQVVLNLLAKEGLVVWASGIEAGWGIKAGSGIEAGEDFGVYCGLRVRVSLKAEHAVAYAKYHPKHLLLGEYKGVKP